MIIKCDFLVYRHTYKIQVKQFAIMFKQNKQKKSIKRTL